MLGKKVARYLREHYFQAPTGQRAAALKKCKKKKSKKKRKKCRDKAANLPL